jgi:hypothetical protein
MTRPSQQLPVFVLSHFFTAFLDDAAQKITSLYHLSFYKRIFIPSAKNFCPAFFSRESYRDLIQELL